MSLPQLSRVPSVTGLARSLAHLACPAHCAACGEPGDAACAQCLAPLRAAPRPHRPDPTPAGLPPVVTVATYSDGVRDLITAWKERGHRALALSLADALAAAVMSPAVRSRLLRVTDDGSPIVLVPMPTSRASYRRRGEDAWGRVVGLAARRLVLHGDCARAERDKDERDEFVVDRCLSLVRQPRDQAGLTAQARTHNLSGAMACERPPSGRVVLVDDVITTGATLAEAARCLALAGAPATVAITLAATPRTAGSARQRRGSTLSS